MKFLITLSGKAPEYHVIEADSHQDAFNKARDQFPGRNVFSVEDADKAENVYHEPKAHTVPGEGWQPSCECGWRGGKVQLSPRDAVHLSRKMHP